MTDLRRVRGRGQADLALPGGAGLHTTRGYKRCQGGGVAGGVAGVAREAGDGAGQAEGGVEVEEGGRAGAEGAQGEVLGVAGQDLQPAAHDGGGAGRVRAGRKHERLLRSEVTLIPGAAAG